MAGDDSGPVARLTAVRRQVAEACAQAGRDPSSVTLVAVSKTVPAGAIARVVAAGQRDFGENRVQEAKGKWPPLLAASASPDGSPGLRLHLIGPLQTNKARDAVALFDAIHSVDRPALCAALARQMTRQERHPRLFVQVNTGAEPQKSGVMPGEADRFLDTCRETYGLRVEGLMCVPPADEPPERHFALLADIAARHRLPCLSMGMSADYQVAIRFGATHVRVGSAVFGPRPAPRTARQGVSGRAEPGG